LPELDPILPRGALEQFVSIYGNSPAVASVAPARVNVIGEHTDYNEGFVLPAAIDRRTWALMSRRNDNRFLCRSDRMDTPIETDLSSLENFKKKGWFSYIAGVASLLLAEGIPLTGVNCSIVSTVPLGSGLSSSAALEVSVALGLLALAERSLPSDRVIRLCQRAEWEWAGVSCGIMDQFITTRGMTGAALLLDCRSLSFDSIPVSPHLTFMVCDTNVPHRLSSSQYNLRREECARAVEVFRTRCDGISTLRDVSESLFETHAPLLDRTSRKRAKHVVSENSRVLRAGDALWYMDNRLLGSLLNDSHASLRDDYNVSSPELDSMAEICRSVEGVWGARMVGAGFGGSVLALCTPESAPEVERRVMDRYPAVTGRQPTVLSCRLGSGARAIRIA
jgi:galactokinase